MTDQILFSLLYGVNIAFLGWCGITMVNLSNRITKIETYLELKREETTERKVI